MIANYDSIDAIICGIGINLNHSDSDFSDDIKQRATSIRLHSNNKINRYSFLKAHFINRKTIFTIFNKSLLQKFEMSILKPQIYGNANCVSLKTTNNL